MEHERVHREVVVSAEASIRPEPILPYVPPPPQVISSVLASDSRGRSPVRSSATYTSRFEENQERMRKSQDRIAQILGLDRSSMRPITLPKPPGSMQSI